MLVTNVSLRPLRAGIAADILEAIEATDATATGQVVFATLVDDPASVEDFVDAYLGEIMIEAASAADTLSGSVPAILAADVEELATAVSAQDAAFAIPPRHAMLIGVFVNSDGTLREANANGVMVNL